MVERMSWAWLRWFFSAARTKALVSAGVALVPKVKFKPGILVGALVLTCIVEKFNWAFSHNSWRNCKKVMLLRLGLVRRCPERLLLLMMKVLDGVVEYEAAFW